MDTRKIERMQYLSRVRGSLIGGAAGDALGYPVEFLTWQDICRRYGADGIRRYTLDEETGTAVFSDDTQMSLFTANGILIWETHRMLEGLQGRMETAVHSACREWLRTQGWGHEAHETHACWLYEIPALHCDRAPGTTCLSALQTGRMGSLDASLNHSKGCGGVMRVAPLALHFRPETRDGLKQLDLDGARMAAITHGHPLGYIPAAILTHLLSIGVYGDGSMSLREAVVDARRTVRELFRERVPAADLDAMDALMLKAETLSQAGGSDEANIRAIGEGWTGDEALAISVYCAMRYPEDFSRAIIAAVNHGGDSDSTGAITGNILGAWLGMEAVDAQWTQKLEMLDVLLEMADDLCFGCTMENLTDAEWIRKYCEGHRRHA